MKYKSKPEHRRNLAILALGLKDKNPSRKFDMNWFVESDDGEVLPCKIKEIINECGTSACAAGWGPIFGIEPKKRESWDGYVNRSFGRSTRMFSTCFESNWPNSPKHAAKRIAWWLTTEKELESVDHEYLPEKISDNMKEFKKFKPNWEEIQKLIYV